MTDAEILAELRKLDARWRDAFNFALLPHTKLAISACGGDLRDVLAGKRVDELEPIVTDEARKEKAAVLASCPPEVLSMLGIREDPS